MSYFPSTPPTSADPELVRYLWNQLRQIAAALNIAEEIPEATLNPEQTDLDGKRKIGQVFVVSAEVQATLAAGPGPHQINHSGVWCVVDIDQSTDPVTVTWARLD